VWAAHDIARNRPVAIKCMTVGTDFLSRRERYLREIEVEARLAHGHIVPLFDSGEIDEVVFFVMPFVDGGSLHARLEREGALPVPDALRIAHEVAEGLAHAHSQGVVHRDIKPGNILFLAGNAVIADFGIARLHDADGKSRTKTTDLIPVGTPHYMSPEQADGDRPVDGRSDLYSLGCVLFEMLVGHPPFEGRTNAEVLQRHALDPVPPIRTVRTPVAAEVEAVVMRAMEKMPADRYPNARTMLEAIEAAMVANPGPLPVRVRQGRRLALTAALAVAVGGGTWWVAGERAMTRLIERADTSFVVLLPLETSDPGLALDDRLRRAFAHWRGLAVADPFSVREELAGAIVTMQRANSTALALGARRFVRGSAATTGTGLEVRLVLLEADREARLLHEVVGRVPLDPGALDSTLAAMVEALVLRASLPTGVRTRQLSSTSIPALQAYVRGRQFIARWDLDSAITAFERAWAEDKSFGSAALWLALSKYWNDARPTEWTYAAYAAVGDSMLMSTREAGAARAMVATSLGDVPKACAEWDAMTDRQPIEFIGWYGAALCRDRDELVRPDARSPSGWVFRSSYQTALGHYLRAYGLMLPMHRALSANSFETVRKQLVVSTGFLRRGSSRDGATFLAAPRLIADTLAYYPFPEMDVVMGAPPTIMDTREDRRVERRQRELFRSLAAMWSAEDRESSEAREAFALALQLLGDVSALDTVRAAVAMEGSGPRRQQLLGTSAWLQVVFAIPDDWTGLQRARTMADSVLAEDEGPGSAEMRASLAALFGYGSMLLRSATPFTGQVDRTLPGPIADATRDLVLVAALGAPARTITSQEQRLDSLIRVLVPLESRGAVRDAAFIRAARLAWTATPLSDGAMASVVHDYLVPLLLASSRGDTVEVRRRFDQLRAMRRTTPPAAVSLDALIAEAAVLARHGEERLASEWLDEALANTRVSTPDFDAVRAAALVRAMALRAELAARLGDRTGARRWAGAVVALWERADPDLQPLVTRMRSLMQ